jgi:hypothetical protein
MKRFPISVAAFIPLFAAASSPVLFPPGQQLAESQAVVIAVPRAIDCQVTGNYPQSGTAKARAKVTWEVLVRWKGSITVGEQFTSDETYAAVGEPCFYSRKEPLLLYLGGYQPFSQVWSYPLGDAVDRLQELEKYGAEGGT